MINQIGALEKQQNQAIREQNLGLPQPQISNPRDDFSQDDYLRSACFGVNRLHFASDAKNSTRLVRT
jgi:hypothetical protein